MLQIHFFCHYDSADLLKALRISIYITTTNPILYRISRVVRMLRAQWTSLHFPQCWGPPQEARLLLGYTSPMTTTHLQLWITVAKPVSR